MLIVIGVCPFLIRDILAAYSGVARGTNWFRAQTLGGNTWPNHSSGAFSPDRSSPLDAVRLSLGARMAVFDAAEASPLQTDLGVPDISG